MSSFPHIVYSTYQSVQCGMCGLKLITEGAVKFLRNWCLKKWTVGIWQHKNIVNVYSSHCGRAVAQSKKTLGPYVHTVRKKNENIPVFNDYKLKEITLAKYVYT